MLRFRLPARPIRRPSLLAVLLVPVLAALSGACTGEDPMPPPTTVAETTGPSQTSPPPEKEVVRGTVTIAVGDRPFRLLVPDSYDPNQPAPLLVTLHGYGSDATEMDSYFGFTELAQARGLLVARPEGLFNPNGRRYWNAIEGACCDFYHSGVDDVAYLSAVIEAVKQSYAVDRVFLVGHSNGAHLSHRMACERAGQITAIAALAGVLPPDVTSCRPTRPVSVLQIHGTADPDVIYEGERYGAGAERTVARWRELNGCTTTSESSTRLDLDSEVKGAETAVITSTGCRDGSRVTLFRMDGSDHIPGLSPAFTPAVIDFLLGSAPA